MPMVGAGELLEATRGFLDRHKAGAVGKLLNGFDWSLPPRDISRGDLACTRHLERAREIASPDAKLLVETLANASASLRWAQTYSASDFGEDFIENYGWTELVGTRGHFMSGSIACGFLILGPHLLYPDHHHVAEEIYLPLTSGTLWRMGTSDLRPRAAGEVVFHGSNVNHAMKTGDEPLVALYLWRGGDLAQRSTITGAA